MQSAEHRDLETQGGLDDFREFSEFLATRTEENLKAHVTTEVGAVRAELGGELSGVRGEVGGLRGEVALVRGALTAIERRFDRLEERLFRKPNQ